MSIASILENAPKLAREWAAEREDRQTRTEADPADYQRLQDLGIPLMAVPVEFGGTWENLAQSARPLCTMLRTLAAGDPSITLSSAMHQGVLGSWRIPTVPEPFNDAWQKQRKEVFQTVVDGAWWGTIVSEPGSGGDTGLTQSRCVPEAPGSLKYRISGQKHFGSGSGLTSFMTTRALAEGETTPDLFFLEVRNQPWDGSTGMRLSAPWRGHGMMSTNSHAFEFKDFPATRVAWPGHQAELMAANSGLGGMSFTSCIIGVVDAAMDYTRQRLKEGMSQGSALRAFVQVEWTMAEQEAFLIDQAWEGTLRSLEQGVIDRRIILMTKECVARLSESVLSRLCKLSGGTAYTWYSPLGAWFEDVRALGYLRPPWALAYDNLFNMGWQD
ncbi:MAG: acyl-CoA/acyl-ACP dehydrogenase [Chloroflexi bacterium]|nr:acyl-CoA/acyl-ACP dehydrogenase [Chloroflexota bacterium]